MVELNEVTPNYHRAQTRWPDAPSLDRHYEALKSCYTGGGFGLIEHVKSFIESVCITIMEELREPMASPNPSLTELLISALNPLGLKQARGPSKLGKVLSCFNRLSDTLSEMRNEEGPVAHGKDGFIDPIAEDHARAFLVVGDSILGVLLNAFEGLEPDLVMTREPYESFPHLNDRIDRSVTVQTRVDEDDDRQVVVFSVATGPMDEAIELRVEPSRLLYGIDREVYIEVLRSAIDEIASEKEKTADLDKAELDEPRESEATASVQEKNTRASMQLSGPSSISPIIRENLKAFLESECIVAEKTDEAGNVLVDSLLITTQQCAGLDWAKRELLQAKMKVAWKRVLVHFDVEVAIANLIAAKLLTWLRIHQGDSELP